MSIQRLPSGKWRAQVYDPASGKNVSVSKVLPDEPGTYRTKTEAKGARERARSALGKASSGVTVAEFRERWTTDPLFSRPKESTNIHNKERTKAFAKKYGAVPVDQVGDAIVAEWLAGGRNNSTVPALRAMFNDAKSAKAGRLITVNPFADLGIKKTKGNTGKLPPAEQDMWKMLEIARELTPPSFAAWLEIGCFTAARPGELDALRWTAIDFDAGEIHLREQWNAKTRNFTEPKYGPYTVALVEHARKTLLGMKRDAITADSPFVFPTLRGTHYTPSSRTHHWNRVRAAAGLGHTTLYMATRHYFGWYATNVLELPPDIVAQQLGHKDGGKLVAELYGHLEGKVARRRIREAFERHGQVRPLRVVGQEAAS